MNKTLGPSFFGCLFVCLFVSIDFGLLFPTAAENERT